MKVPDRRNISIRAWLEALATDTGAFKLAGLVPAAGNGRPAPSIDYVATLLPAGSRKAIKLNVLTRSRFTPREAVALANDSSAVNAGSGALLIACPAISPRAAAICRRHGVGYLDQAGNCDIRAPGLALHVDGRPPAARDTRPLSTPFAPKAGRVARLLLSSPTRTWKVQDLARQGRISLGLASKAKNALVEQAYVVVDGGRLRLADPAALLMAWSAVYRPPYQRTNLYVMQEPEEIELAVAAWCEQNDVTFGLAEYAGAWRLAPMVRYRQPSVAVLESGATDIVRGIQISLDAKSAVSGSNLVILSTGDESVFFDILEVGRVRVLSPLQHYLDLHAQPGRGREAAQEILHRLLIPSWKAVSADGGRQ
ncbi:MAG: hypothetical protein C4547_14205 [Phycisphaerales bacterium]|nr:MAG: hypothetical protein C4547_14205 [Phycisphaerales bacterium]